MYMERSKILKNWKEHVQNISKAAHSLLRNCEVYAFGSAASRCLTAASDIDVLIIAEGLPKRLIKRAELKVKIEIMANLPAYHPIQIHLLEKNEAKCSSVYSRVNKENIVAFS